MNTVRNEKRLCIVIPYVPPLGETFINCHIEQLPAQSIVVHGWRPSINDRPVLSVPRLAVYKLWRAISGSSLERETTAAYLKVFRCHRVDAVLAEFGEMGVVVSEACNRAGIPLIVHFHGYDASVRSVLEQHTQTYPDMFKKAAALVAVSHAMRDKLISLGAPPEKVYYNSCGVDPERFSGAKPASAGPILVAVGRFTEKKAPHLTLAAFAQVYRANRLARLRMIGDGALLAECRALADKLQIAQAVTFLGAQDHVVIGKELRQARGFVQHSVEAPSGDSEGTPVGILEAAATGLPVVSTRHAGIPDVVIEGETGFLVDEGDVDGMAKHMLRLIEEPLLAEHLGRAARKRIQEGFSEEKSLGRLWAIIESCIADAHKKSSMTPQGARLQSGARSPQS